MAVGQQPTVASVNGTLTSLALRKRDLANEIIQQWSYLNKLGLAGLEATGFTAPDAQAVLDDVNHLVTPEQVYKGTATQATAFPFEDAVTHLWGGQ